MDFLFRKMQKIYCLPGKMSIFQGLFFMKLVSTHNDNCQREMTVMDKTQNPGCIRHAWLESMDIVQNNICLQINYIIFSGKNADPGRISTNPAFLNRLLRTSVLFLATRRFTIALNFNETTFSCITFNTYQKGQQEEKGSSPQKSGRKVFL